MIKIDRSTEPVPSSLTTAGNVVDNERIAAQRYYAVVRVPSKTYKFKRYKEEDIVAALEHLFHGKCAYCESKYIGTQKMDVEHYRPKGKVNESRDHPGYWWLALEWENLLPSCTDCNRRRGQKSYNLQADGTIVFIDDSENSGKECAFPVSGAYRAQRSQDDLNQEAPLLVNPCDHDPGDHLRWHVNNLKIPLLLANSIQNIPDEMGIKSIEIMGLNRFGLVTRRAEVLQPVAVQVNSIYELIEITATLQSGVARDSCLAKIGRDIDALQTCYEPNREYSAMVKFYIDSHMDVLKEYLAGLLA